MQLIKNQKTEHTIVLLIIVAIIFLITSINVFAYDNGYSAVPIDSIDDRSWGDDGLIVKIKHNVTLYNITATCLNSDILNVTIYENYNKLTSLVAKGYASHTLNISNVITFIFNNSNGIVLEGGKNYSFVANGSLSGSFKRCVIPLAIPYILPDLNFSNRIVSNGDGVRGSILADNYVHNFNNINVLNWTAIAPNVTYNNTLYSLNNITTSLFSSFNVTSYIQPNQLTNMTTLNSSNTIYYSLNTSLNNGCAIFYQKQCALSGTYIPKLMTQTSNTSTSQNFTYSFYDNNYYSAYYPFNYEVFDNTLHLNQTIYKNNDLRFNVFNMSIVSNYYLNLEFSAISLLNSGNLLIYYCNSSYINGDVATSNNCQLVDSFAPTTIYSHSHKNNSKHQAIPIIINTVAKTQNCSFIFVNNNVANGWNFGYITNSTYDNTSFVLGNMNTWSYTGNTNKIFDIHIHPYATGDNFRFYSIFTDTNGIVKQSYTTYIYYNISYTPPITPEILTPNCSAQYTIGSLSDINFSWTNSYSQLNLSILYDVSIIDIVDNSEIFIAQDLNVTYFYWSSVDWNLELNSRPYTYYKTTIYSKDIIDFSTQTQNCNWTTCRNNWIQLTQPCINNVKLNVYEDNNYCNEKINLPTTNGTYTTCVVEATEGEESIANGLYALVLLLLMGLIYKFYNKKGGSK